jgi:hypothetical protein
MPDVFEVLAALTDLRIYYAVASAFVCVVVILRYHAVHRSLLPVHLVCVVIIDLYSYWNVLEQYFVSVERVCLQVSYDIFVLEFVFGGEQPVEVVDAHPLCDRVYVLNLLVRYAVWYLQF